MSGAGGDLLTALASLVVVVGTVAFTIAMIVIWIVNRRQMRPYLRVGLALVGILVSLDLLSLVALSEPLNVAFVLGAELAVGLRTLGYLIVGLFLAHRLGLPGIRLGRATPAPLPPNWRSRAERAKLAPDGGTEVATAPADGAADDGSLEVEERVEVDADEALGPEAVVAEPPPAAAALGDPLGLTPALIGALVALLYSVLLIVALRPEYGSLFAVVGLEPFGGNGFRAFLFSGLLVTVLALSEEIIFRHGVQNMVAAAFGWRGRRYRWAIVVACALWTLGHVGSFDPNWIKFVQVFPLGLMFGWLYQRYGLQSAALSHIAFNLAIVVVEPFLAIG